MNGYFMTTERIGFSLWREEDLPKAIELWGNPKITKFINANGNMTEEEIKQRLKKEIETYESSEIQYWPIYLLETKEFVGCCGLRPYDISSNTLEMGIHLKEKYWRLGLAEEACYAVIKYAFNNIKVSSLFAGHNPNNKASEKLLKRLGFKYTHEEFYPPTGLNHPSYLISKSDFKFI